MNQTPPAPNSPIPDKPYVPNDLQLRLLAVRPELTSSERECIKMALRYTKWEDGRMIVYWPEERNSVESGVNRKRVQSAKKKLREAGLISILERGQHQRGLADLFDVTNLVFEKATR